LPLNTPLPVISLMVASAPRHGHGALVCPIIDITVCMRISEVAAHRSVALHDIGDAPNGQCRSVPVGVLPDRIATGGTAAFHADPPLLAKRRYTR
jgi:hypothetical protein